MPSVQNRSSADGTRRGRSAPHVILRTRPQGQHRAPRIQTGVLILWAGIVLVLASFPANAESVYAWPMDLPRAITSSFCEYRVGRFHAGIDLRTGAVGVPVRAPADGYVARVRCSPTGYGKAIYLRLTDGNTVVFGHLNDFCPDVGEYVRSAQHAAQTYTVDLHPEPGAFPVKCAQIVAFSGQTGVGVPHLHYEIRDAQERPFNPRFLDIAWPDTTRPVIRKLLVAPAGLDSSVNGDIVTFVCDVAGGSGGEYTSGPIRAAGRIAFGVDIVDPANNGANILGIHVLRTIANGEEVFRIAHDRVSYSHINNGTVAYHPFMLDKGRFLLQWRWPGNVCEIFAQTDADGWFRVPGAPVEVRIEAGDFFGNRAALTVPIIPDAQTPPAPPAQPGTGEGAVDLACVGTWLVVTAAFTAPEPESPVLEVNGLVPVHGSPFRRINDTTFRAGIVPGPSMHEIEVRVIHDRIRPYARTVHVFQRGEGDRTVTIDGVTVNVKSGSPYGALFLRTYPASRGSPSSIPMRGKPLRIWPASMPIDRPVDVAFPVPEDAQDLGRVQLYRDTGSTWQPVTTRRTKDHLVMSSRQFGIFAALEDDVPPAISEIAIERGADAHSKRPAIHAKVTDIGSGIADITVTCNGQWLLMAYDPERNVIEWEQDEDLPAGHKEFLFTVTDGAGNTTTANKIGP